MGRTRQRDAKIEFIRVVACFLVILNHIMIVPTSGDGVFYDATAALVALIWTDVPLFLLISGFLMFQRLDLEHLWNHYVHKIKNFMVYVLIPSCIVVVISGVLAPFLTGDLTWAELLAEKNLHLECIKNYIFMQQTSSIYSVFWYIWVYAKIIAFFPLLVLLCQDVKDKNIIRRFLMLVSALNIAFVDLQNIAQKTIGNFDNYTLDKYFLYILLGYEIYLLSKRKSEQKLGIYGGILLGLSVVASVAIEHICFYAKGTEYMTTLFNITASVGMFLLLYAIARPKRPNFWSFVGRNTLYIYMVHIIVIFSCEKIWGKFFWNLFGAGGNVLWLILYDAIYGMIIFSISLLLALLLQVIYEKGILLLINKMYFGIKGIRKGRNE